MEPIGHIAGIGASIIGFLSTLVSVSLAAIIGQFVEKTAIPIFVGFTICGILSLLLMYFTKPSNKKVTINLTESVD